jgi:hypothetical protein
MPDQRNERESERARAAEARGRDWDGAREKREVQGGAHTERDARDREGMQAHTQELVIRTGRRRGTIISSQGAPREEREKRIAREHREKLKGVRGVHEILRNAA